MKIQKESFIEWVDGFLLGDGHIGYRSKYGFAYIGCKHKEWAEYAMSGFADYHPNAPSLRRQISKRYNKVYEGWQIATRSHMDLAEQKQRWYRKEGNKYIKNVPDDVRITPTSLLLWYLGDGTYSGGDISIAAYDFTEEDNRFLASLIAENLGLHCALHKSKGFLSKLYFPAAEIEKFFDTIGRTDPTGCYPEKFSPPGEVTYRGGQTRGRQSLSLMALCKNLGIDYSWASYIIRQGRVEVDHVGGLVHPTERGKEQLKEIVRTEYRPRDGSEKTTFTQDDVLKELRVHPRRMKDLREKAGINPVRTPGGQWRYTPEEVEAMRPFAEKRHSDPMENKRSSK